MPKAILPPNRKHPDLAMPKAANQVTALSDLIARLKCISAGDFEPPCLPHDDYDLLELSAEALQLIKAERDVWNEQTDQIAARNTRRDVRECAIEAREIDARTRALLRRIGKIPAKTPGGLFAKASLVRASKSGVTVFLVKRFSMVFGLARLH